MTRILDARCPGRDTVGAPHGSVALWITAWTWVIEDGCDATIPAVPRGGGAIWGRDRIERARRRWTLVRPPLPAVPHEDAPRTGRAAGEAAATRWCDTANAPGRGPIRGRDRIGRAPALRPLPHPGPYLECPRRTRLKPALGLAGRLRRGCAISTVPRVGGPIRGRDRIGEGADRGATPPPGPYPRCPRRQRLG